MNFNAIIASAFEIFKSAATQKPSSSKNNFNKNYGMSMNQSIFAGQFQNNDFGNFGFQRTGGARQSIDSFAQRAESAIEKGKGALESMKASGNGDVWVAETNSRIAMSDLRAEIESAIETATDADKAKLKELSKQLEQAEKAQTDARVKVLEETLDADNKVLEENCPREVGVQLYDDAEKAKTKAEIEKLMSDIKKHLDGCNKALGQVKIEGNKAYLKATISSFNQKLGALEQRKASLKPEEDKRNDQL